MRCNLSGNLSGITIERGKEIAEAALLDTPLPPGENLPEIQGLLLCTSVQESLALEARGAEGDPETQNIAVRDAT